MSDTGRMAFWVMAPGSLAFLPLPGLSLAGLVGTSRTKPSWSGWSNDFNYPNQVGPIFLGASRHGCFSGCSWMFLVCVVSLLFCGSICVLSVALSVCVSMFVVSCRGCHCGYQVLCLVSANGCHGWLSVVALVLCSVICLSLLLLAIFAVLLSCLLPCLSLCTVKCYQDHPSKGCPGWTTPHYQPRLPDRAPLGWSKYVWCLSLCVCVYKRVFSAVLSGHRV